MTISVDDGGSFEFLSTDRAFAIDDADWLNGRIPFKWLRAYGNEIVILRNGFSQAHLDRVLMDEEMPMEVAVAGRMKEYINLRYDLDVSLPPAKVAFVDGNADDWRMGIGDLVASWCNGCGDTHLTYVLITQADVENAEWIESRHPAIPFLYERELVTFRGGAYMGCYCGRGERDPYDPDESIEDLLDAEAGFVEAVMLRKKAEEEFEDEDRKSA